MFRCGIVPEGDLEAGGEGERFEGEMAGRENMEQPNQDVELELEEEDEVGVELLQVVVDFA